MVMLGGAGGTVGRAVVKPSSLELLLPLPLTSKRRTVVYSSEVTTSEEDSAEEEVTPGTGRGGKVV